MKVISVVGARPNFMKVAPLHSSFLKRSDVISKVVHTGQHYDERMSDIFFNQLALPKPDYYLGVGSGSHAVVTANIMIAFEKIVLEEKPDLVLVVGDVNSTLACAIVAKKLNIQLAHVEAGLRSNERTMPEELNRIMTDSISDYLFITEQSGIDNLKHEGVPDHKVFFTGNVMIDSLFKYRDQALELDLLSELGIAPKDYVLMTMHRPANVDHPDKLKIVVDLIKKIATESNVILPLHPRTESKLKAHGFFDELSNLDSLTLIPPQGYLQFIYLMMNSNIIITDSGGIQEETTALKIPCITVRDSTERPITVEMGSNTLVPNLNIDAIYSHYKASFKQTKENYQIPPLWDGNAADRIVDILYDKHYQPKSTNKQMIAS